MRACVCVCVVVVVVVVVAFRGVVDRSALFGVFSFIVRLFVGLATSLRMVIRARQMNEREEAKRSFELFGERGRKSTG